jgi:putative aldouronate transport system permease protein
MTKSELSKVKAIKHSWRLYILMLPAVVWLFVLVYYPMYGLLIAFKNFRPRLGITGSPFAEPIFKHFITFFSTNIAGIRLQTLLY